MIHQIIPPPANLEAVFEVQDLIAVANAISPIYKVYRSLITGKA